MAKRAIRNRPLLSIDHSVKIEIRQAKLTPLESLKHLDVAKLKKASRAEVELGHIEGGCCSQLVRAVIRKGMVTDIAIDQCPDAAKVTPDLARLLNKARRKAKAALGGRTDREPAQPRAARGRHRQAVEQPALHLRPRIGVVPGQEIAQLVELNELVGLLELRRHRLQWSARLVAGDDLAVGVQRDRLIADLRGSFTGYSTTFPPSLDCNCNPPVPVASPVPAPRSSARRPGPTKPVARTRLQRSAG